jgi:hypothetical protein
MKRGNEKCFGDHVVHRKGAERKRCGDPVFRTPTMGYFIFFLFHLLLFPMWI